jgi:hypothetical protein
MSQANHQMIQTIHKFFAFRGGMRPEDAKDRNPRPFDNGSDLNWRGIFFFVVYLSVVIGFFLFFRNGNYGSVDGPAPIPPSQRSLQTIEARPWFKVSNEGLQLEGPAFDREGHSLFFWKATATLNSEKSLKLPGQ